MIHIWRWLVSLGIIVFLHLSLGSYPVAAEALPSLTVELLRDRMEQPQTQDQTEFIDLRGFKIDLQNEEIKQELIDQVQRHFNLAHPDRVLDLSHSTIQGSFPFKALGSTVRLTPDVLHNQLTDAEWQAVQAHPDLLAAAHVVDFAQLPTWHLVRLALRCEQTQFGGAVDSSKTLVLKSWSAPEAVFQEGFNGVQTVWLDAVRFPEATFGRTANFEQAQFWSQTDWSESNFEAAAQFAYSQFEQTAQFNQATFAGLGNWRGSFWAAGADFSQTHWRDRALWNGSRVQDTMDLSEAVFEQTVAWRTAQFSPGSTLSLRQATVIAQLDLSNSNFAPDALLNLDGLVFGSLQTQVIGDRGSIGSLIHLGQLEGNETTLANLIRNFRRLEQIPDANRLEVLRSRLWLQQLETRLRATPWWRWWQELGAALQGLGVGMLLWLSEDGTNVKLVLLVGLVGMVWFALVFWIIDRFRRPDLGLVPSQQEQTLMLGSGSGLLAIALLALVSISPQPAQTLVGISLWVIPIPTILTWQLYRQGRYHHALESTYLVEDGGIRQLHLLIIRLPIMAKFPFFRDRYTPILCDRGWGWLNYYDFSLNNLFKFGFNDLRLRDHDVPGLVTALVWYQWGLGLGYIALLLWTLARTIPGLNLLLYLS